MLTHLRITDFALLDDVTLELGAGFNVLTGETGAGKSLLVEAVALLRGGRASAEVVRAGAAEARIEAVFEPDGSAAEALTRRLVVAGIDEAADGLVIRRHVANARGDGKSGRGRIYVNGTLTTAAVLADLAGGLIDLAGQHEHQGLTDPSRHLALLDAYGVPPADRERMATAYGALSSAAAELGRLSLDERQRAEREDFLRFQLRELDEAGLEAGEDERLKAERERLRHAGKLLAVARRAEVALYTRESAIAEELGQLARDLAEVGRVDPALAALGAQIDEARVGLEDAAESLRRYGDGMHDDPERLAQVEDRLHLVHRLVRKHAAATGAAPGAVPGAAIEDVIARRHAMAEELAALGSHEQHRAAAEEALAVARRGAAVVATALSGERARAATALARRVSAELSLLGMAGARLAAEVTARPAREGEDGALLVEGRRVGATGWDRVELLLAANPGDEPRPLARVASGGELSRITLALKRVLARADLVTTYVFDEVDSGIGGPVADVVGRQLKQVAADKQVLCVTHLPQIAAYGDAHFHVSKRTAGGRTSTVVSRLDHEARIEELARMVGGARVTPRARAHAEDLIRHARVPA